MPLIRETPSVDQLSLVLEALADWQQDGIPVQLHPGDLGWQWRFGAGAVADNLRVWRRDGQAVAIGFLDGDVASDDAVLRLAVAPAVDQDHAVADAIARDLEDDCDGVMTTGSAVVEARFGQALRTRLTETGWLSDEPWTPLRRDLAEPVDIPENPGSLRVEVVQPDDVADRVAVQATAFKGSSFTADRWRVMASGPLYQDARCLVGYDDSSQPVAVVTVWSAGRGRPGLLEPMGVHRDHRGRGYGRAITLAAAVALQQLGASSALVATPAANVGAVATYAAAGFVPLPDVTDFKRPPDGSSAR